jgi:hypothetical protein
VRDIAPSQLESAIVLQSIAATQLFGEKGKYGAIIYNIKHGVALNDTNRHYSVDVYSATYPATDTKPAKQGYGAVVSSADGLSLSHSASGIDKSSFSTGTT